MARYRPNGMPEIAVYARIFFAMDSVGVGMSTPAPKCQLTGALRLRYVLIFFNFAPYGFYRKEHYRGGCIRPSPSNVVQSIAYNGGRA